MVARERHGLGKTVVRAIKKLRTEGKSQQEIATLYGVSRECISSIDTGRRRE
jgi:transcriptional regulator